MIKIIIKESVQSPNNGIAFLKKRAKSLAARGHDISSLRVLGSGLHGHAYEMPNGRVFKLTDDVLEAQASRVIMGKKTTYIVNIYDVFKFKGTNLFGIVQEKLSRLDSQEKAFWNEMSDLGVISIALAGTGIAPWSKIEPELNDVLSDNAPEEENLGLTPKEKKNIVAKLKKYNFPNMVDELYKYGIEYDDFHGENIMKRGKTSVIIDLGYSRVKNPEEIQMIEKKNNPTVQNKQV